jgi:hypothetical protein
MAYVADTDLASTVPGKGADMVGFLQSGSGAVGRTARAKLADTFHVDDFGAVGDGSTDDFAAISVAFDALVDAGGGTLKFGRKHYIVSSGSLEFDTGDYETSVVFEGEGANTVLEQRGTGLSLFKLGCQQTIRSCGIRNMDLRCDSDAGHVIEIGDKGITLFELKANITQSNLWKHIIYAPYGEIYDSWFHHSDWYLTAGHKVAGVYVRANRTSFNENIFENLRVYHATDKPFYDIQGDDLPSWNVNNTFRQINFEICRGGGIKFANARGWTFQNLSFWDASGLVPEWSASTAYDVGAEVYNAGLVYTCTSAGTSAASGGPTGLGTGIVDGSAVWSFTGAYTGHLIHAADNAGYQSVGNTFIGVQRHGDSVATAIRDIYLEDADFSAVINCFTPADIAPSYDWNNRRVTVLGLMYGEINTAQTATIRGDYILSHGIVVGYSDVIGARLYGDDHVSLGGINNPEMFRLAHISNNIGYTAMANNFGHVWTAKDIAGVESKLVFTADGVTFAPLTTAKTSLGLDALRFDTLHLSGGVNVDGVQVVGSRQASIPDDQTASSNKTTVNAILAALRAHGLIA